MALSHTPGHSPPEVSNPHQILLIQALQSKTAPRGYVVPQDNLALQHLEEMSGETHWPHFPRKLCVH